MPRPTREPSGGGRLPLGDGAEGTPPTGRAVLAGPVPAMAGRQALDAGLDLRGADRLREVVALAVRAAQRAHPLGLLLRLDPLGHGGDVEGLAERDDRTRQRCRARVVVGDLHELAGDFERVDRELAQVAEREVAGPEV